jgi:hypothetical protein
VETASVSVTAWVNIPSGVPQQGWASVLKKTFADDSVSPYGSYSLHFSPNNLTNHVSFYIGYAEGGKELVSPGPIPSGRWVHLAATYEPAAAQRKLYVDGILVAQDDLDQPIAYDQTDTGDLYLGHDPGPGEALLGRLDDVAVWGRALTPGEVLALALDAPPDVTPPVVGSAEILYDAAPHRLLFHFSEAVVGADNPLAYTLVNETTGQTFLPQQLSVSYDPLTFTSTLGLRSPRGVLPDGDYTISLNASLITDIAANPLDPFSFSTFFLLGDVNRDRTIDHLDFNTLFRNFGATGDRATFSAGDLNFDQTVGFADFQIMELAFGRTLDIQSPVVPPLPLRPTTKSPARRPTRRPFAF